MLKANQCYIIVGLIILFSICWLLFFNSPTHLVGELKENNSANLGSGGSDISEQTEAHDTNKSSKLDSQFDELEGYGVSPKDVRGDLQLVHNLINAFNIYVKKDGELPTAGNRQLMKAMMGDNIYKMRFVHDDFKFLNENGEIVDRWGAPLIFHFVDRNFPEVRSIGPDGKAGTSDDIIVSFSNNSR